MRFKFNLLPVIVLCFVLGLVTVPSLAEDGQALPELPEAFYGAIEINGIPAPTGTIVEARGAGVIVGSAGNPIVTTEEGKYGTQDPLGAKLVVQSDLLKNGDIIEFYINGLKAEQTCPFTSGEIAELKLTLTIPNLTLYASVSPPGSGAVILNPPQPAEGYSPGTEVILTATANPNYTFEGWSGDLNGNTNPVTITIDSNKSVKANFTPVKFTLTVSISPAGGAVNINPEPKNGGYEIGTQVTLTANANLDYIFTGWSGDLNIDINPVTITMNSNKKITANFAAIIAQNIIALPHALYGAVEINGQPAPIGTTVEARGPGVLIGDSGNPIVTTEEGRYGSQGPLGIKLVVQSDLLKSGDVIEFYIDGLKADQTCPFASGEVTELNLTVSN